MFVLTTIQDKLSTIPEYFDRPRAQVLKEQIEVKYSNKVILEVGLCVCFYDFLEVGDPFIYPSEGSAIQDVRFRIVVFKPFIGEVLTGRVTESSATGLRVSLEFFEDVLVPSAMLQEPSHFLPSVSSSSAGGQGGMWVWKYGDEQDEGAEARAVSKGEHNNDQRFVIEKGDEIRFKVRVVSFNAASALAASSSLSTPAGGSKGIEPASTPLSAAVPVMEVVGCTNDFGLGLISWW
eukprot:gene30335-39564_t